MREEEKHKGEYRFSEDIRRWLWMFFVIAAAITLYFIILRWKEIRAFLGAVGGILQPILFGLSFAYLLRTPTNFFERKIRQATGRETLARGASLVVVYLLSAAFFYILGSMIWPELRNNVTNLITSLPDQLGYVSDQVQQKMTEHGQIASVIETATAQLEAKLEHWLNDGMWQTINVAMSVVTSGVVDVVNVLLNLIIGIIVSVYVLTERRHFARQGKKLIYACFRPKEAKIVLHTIEESDRIFSGFITGKLLDSLIIGLLCFASLSVMGMPYTVLVSVIVGVTNVIPFFGPYIGAIPSAILILLASPKQGLIFIVFILILQQLDGNVIGPKILGESTGLSAFWVIFAILLAGGLFGIVGMIIGVPAFGVIYYIVKTFVNYRLHKNGSMRYIETDGK